MNQRKWLLQHSKRILGSHERRKMSIISWETNLGFYEWAKQLLYLGKTMYFDLINKENDYYNATNNFMYQWRWLLQLEKDRFRFSWMKEDNYYNLAKKI